MSHAVMTLFECVGIPTAWRLIIGSAIIVVLYMHISLFRFYPAYTAARTFAGKVIWGSITFIFPFCGCAGYATVVVSGWYPDLAYTVKEIAIYCDIAFCFSFLFATHKQQFVAIGETQVRARKG